jgi:DNA invertase Pin-like site-specific DNA recombinase
MRVIVAARLSKLQRDGREGIGIETQDERSREWAEREGHEVVAVVADTKSGTVAPMDRRHLAPWVTDPALMARYDAVVAFKTDRLSRGTQEDFTRIEHWATEHGKRLVIVDGPQYPARDDSDYWRWAAEKRTARVEWENDRERSMRAQAALRDAGTLVGRYPWGYTSEGARYDRRMVPTDEGRRLVPQVYARVAAGQSLTVVAAWLAEQTGRPWWPRTVAALIRNPAYRGSRQDARGREIHRCEPLVTGQQWRDAVANLDARPKRGTHAAETSALSGVLRCIKCGGPMYRVVTGSGNQARVAYYRCAGKGPIRTSACRNMIRCDRADALVDDVMGGLDVPVIEWRLVKGHSHDGELADVDLALRDLAGQGLTEDAEDERRAALRAERKRLRGLPAVPDRWEPRETGETYAGQWAALAPAARRAWLKRYAPKLFIGKPGMLWGLWMQSPDEGETGAADEIGPGFESTTHTGHGCELVIVWAPLAV